MNTVETQYITNEWYAKDTSKKIRAVMKVKGNAGEHLTTLPPYGYMKSPDNKKLWVRDEEAAAVVYEIGLYVMDGFGPSQIARKLTERRILTPAAYYASRGRKASNIKRGLPYAWDASTVADIMDRWREYLGHTVNFKTRKKSYKSKKVIHNPESEWMIFENTHDPIWTEAIADAARAARQTRRRPTKMGEMGMFSGMMFCADCGSVMYQCRATNFRREQEYYLCAGYRKSRDFCGQTHSIRTVILEELILENLREIVSFASRSKDEFVRLVMDSDLRQRDRDLAKRKRQLADSEKRITELDAIFKRLYEDNISGKLSDERFQKLSADYEKEEQELKVLTSSLQKEVELEESKSADVDRFLSVVERYTDIPELTPCILHEFVEKIIVHAASDPKGKNRTQEIDIYYKGIGALEMSKVTASMEKRENGTAEAIPFSLSSRCFLIGSCLLGSLFFCTSHTRPVPAAASVWRRSSMASCRIISLTFMRRMVLARSFSSSFIVIYLMLCCICGILTYSSALTLLRVRSISAARSCVAFSTSARRRRSGRISPSSRTASSSSPLVWAKP